MGQRKKRKRSRRCPKKAGKRSTRKRRCPKKRKAKQVRPHVEILPATPRKKKNSKQTKNKFSKKMKSASSPTSKPIKRRVTLRTISIKKKARKRKTKAKRTARGRRVQRAKGKGKVKHSTRMRIALPEGAFATSALVRDGFISGNNGGGGTPRGRKGDDSPRTPRTPPTKPPPTSPPPAPKKPSRPDDRLRHDGGNGSHRDDDHTVFAPPVLPNFASMSLENLSKPAPPRRRLDTSEYPILHRDPAPVYSPRPKTDRSPPRTKVHLPLGSVKENERRRHHLLGKKVDEQERKRIMRRNVSRGGTIDLNKIQAKWTGREHERELQIMTYDERDGFGIPGLESDPYVPTKRQVTDKFNDRTVPRSPVGHHAWTKDARGREVPNRFQLTTRGWSLGHPSTRDRDTDPAHDPDDFSLADVMNRRRGRTGAQASSSTQAPKHPARQEIVTPPFPPMPQIPTPARMELAPAKRFAWFGRRER